jgi:hypothetical protein
MEQLSKTITVQAAEGWRLHSLQPVPIFGGSLANNPESSCSQSSSGEARDCPRGNERTWLWTC